MEEKDILNTEPREFADKKNEMTVAISVAILAGVAVLAYIFISFYPQFFSFLKDDGVTVENAVSTIEDKYGIAINLPEGWTTVDCSSEEKRYVGHIRYVCRWLSPAYPGGNVKTTLYLFVSDNKKKEISSDELVAFARERQEYGWAGEIKRNPSLSVIFDKTVDPVSFNGWNGVRTDDLIKNTKTELDYLWASTAIPMRTSRASVILVITHPNEILYTKGMYLADDVLQFITVSDFTN